MTTRACFAVAGTLALLVGAGGEEPKDYKDIDPKTLGVELVEPKKDPKTGFIVGGKNATDALLKLTEINGRKIADLEADMRPGAPSDVASTKGFLGKEEKLLEVLAMDNRYVVDDLGLTHPELAKHLRIVGAVGLKHLVDSGKAGKPSVAKEFTYHGRKFKVTVAVALGYQLSPFKDGTQTNNNAVVYNLTNGKKLGYSLLVPHMIERYGFYEGKGTPYRVEPREVLEVFDFLKKKAN